MERGVGESREWDRDGAGDGAERRVGGRTLYARDASLLNNNNHHRSSGSEVTDAKRETI